MFSITLLTLLIPVEMSVTIVVMMSTHSHISPLVIFTSGPENIAIRNPLNTKNDNTVAVMAIVKSRMLNSAFFHGRAQTTLPVSPLTRIVLCFPS